MTDAYRQKILRWFLSIGLLLLGTSMSILLYWYSRAVRFFDPRLAYELSDFAGPLSGAFLIFILVFPLVGFWHFWDFLQRGNAVQGRLSSLAGYSVFLVNLAATTAINTAIASGIFSYSNCDHLGGGVFYFQCYESTPVWLTLPFMVALAIALMLGFLKSIASLRSRRAK